MIEVAAALVVGAAVVDKLAMVPAGVVAVILVLFAVVRRRGRSLPEWLGTVLALRARKRRAASTPVPPGTEPGLAPAVECDPSLRTYSYSRGDDRDQRPIGMVGDGGFLTAVLQVESDATALRAERSRRPLPIGIVRDALDVDGIQLESAQIVLHTQPAPALHLPQQSVAVSNYAPLQAQTGSPAVRITWIALKLDPELCPEAVAARGGGTAGAQKCVARAAQHLAKPADRRGLPRQRADGGGAHGRRRHVGVRQPHGDGAGRAERAAAAQDRGVRPQLALRQPQAHHVLGAALAAARRIRARSAPVGRTVDHGARAGHDVQPDTVPR